MEFPRNDSGTFIARLTTLAMERLRQGSPIGREVLLSFDNNDPERPVIIDTMGEPGRAPSGSGTNGLRDGEIVRCCEARKL